MQPDDRLLLYTGDEPSLKIEPIGREGFDWNIKTGMLVGKIVFITKTSERAATLGVI